MNFKKAELLILIFILVLNLRVLTWYSGDNLLIRGDFRPPIEADAYLQNAGNMWNQVDLGLPSVYSPRLLDPFISSDLLFEKLGVSPQLSEIVAVYLIYVLVSLLVFFYIKFVTGDLLASTVGAIFFVTNVHLVVDMEQSAIGFVEAAAMIMPSVATFLWGIRRKSTLIIALSGILFVLNYASFPNYRNALLSLTILIITIIFAYLKDRKIPLKKYLLTFALFASTASVWLVAVLATTYGYLSNAFSQAINTNYGGKTNVIDVLRFITKWDYYDAFEGNPYTPYRNVYDNLAMIFLTLLPTLLAFSSLMLSKRRKISVYFSITAIVALILTSGVIPISQIRFMLIFRESANWTLLAILPLSVLIGLFLSGLVTKFKKKFLKVIAVIAIVSILCVSAYPLFTGDIADNWLSKGIKGSSYPKYIIEAKEYIDGRYWTLLIPNRIQYLVYDFPEGKLACGNIYPMLSTFPYISGLGTEYVKANNSSAIEEILNMPVNNTDTYLYWGKLGIKYVLVEHKITTGLLTDAPTLDLPVIKSWSDAVLYDNHFAVEKLFSPNNKLEWVEESSTRYHATINASQAFDIVLLENYESNWHLSVNGQEIAESNHLKYSGIANMWTITQTGPLSIEIVYAPQSTMILAIVLSVGMTFILLIVMLLLKFTARIRKWCRKGVDAMARMMKNRRIFRAGY